MKRPIIIYLIILLLFPFYYSCEEEINVFVGGDPAPIAYCLLNPYDSVQYVRLTRTYIVDNGTSGYPSSVDSLYFDGEIQVSLERWENYQVKEIIEFEQYDSIIKEPGDFPTEKNILFRYFGNIYPEGKYILYINLIDRNLKLYAETITVGELDIIDPLPFTEREITLTSEQNYDIKFNLALQAWIYQTSVIFYYDEITEDDTIRKSIEWIQTVKKPNFQTREHISIRLNGSKFYQVLKNEISENSNVKRKALDFSFNFYYGGTDLRFYVESITPSSSVLQEKPSYTNFTNSQGIFSSLAIKRIENIQFSKIMIDSIAHSAVSKSLGFVDSKDSLYIQ